MTPASIGLTLPPPVAQRKRKVHEMHGVRWEDPYSWLRDPGYPDVEDAAILDHLKSENRYFEAALRPFASLTDRLFAEIKGRIKEDDEGVPFKDGAWVYQWRFAPGAQYRTWYRRPADGGEWTVLLDEATLAADQDYFRLGGMAWSPDAKLLAWSSDTDGSERYTMRIKNLETGALYEDIPETIGSPVWADDNQTLFYLVLSPEWRPFQVKAHTLGTSPETDRLVYEEADPSFFVGLAQTQSRGFVVIASEDHVTSEVRLVPSDQPEAPLTLVDPRQAGRQYSVEHRGDTLYILTNDTHSNFRLAQTAVTRPESAHWTTLIEGSESRYLRNLVTFSDFMVLQERVDGLDRITVRTYAGDEHAVDFPESVCAAQIGNNPEFEVDRVRLAYESMVTPDTVFDYHVAQQRLETLKVREIPSGYDASKYITKRLMAPGRDGVRIPVSLVYRSDFPQDGTWPLHLYAYGAYGLGQSPSFSPVRLSLLDRGFVYAIAHIRGGDDMGYGWYLDGKLEKRENAFNDFLDVATFLEQEGYASPGNISISGGSAGGKLMGVMANRAPERWRAVVAQVPFVDVLHTMLDGSLPLTPMEWPEWGNPGESTDAFATIRAYSPYDNVQAQDYPPMLVTAGLSDPRVTYWEPAKWVARLRAKKTDDNLLLLKTNMGAGHGGKSGRYERLHEVAEEFTFLLIAFGHIDARH